jgi:hypothetical protein
MPNQDFYALGSDFSQVLNFVFEQPGWVLHELASVPDHPVRIFNSTESLFKAFRLGTAEHHFQLYSPEMAGKVIHQKIIFNPGAVPGATHRYDTQGWGLIQLYFGRRKRDGGLTNSHTNHNSEKRAVNWASLAPELGNPSKWDWPAVARCSGRLNRFIKKCGVSKFNVRPVLADAQQAVEAGRAQFVL